MRHIIIKIYSYFTPVILAVILAAVSQVQPCSAQSAANACIPLQVNPYPGLGTDGLTGQRYVSNGMIYGNYAQNNPAYNFDGVTTGVLPVTPLNGEELEELEIGSHLPPAEGAEIYLSRMPTGKRTGMFQKVNFNTLWTPKSGSRGVGFTQFDVSASFAVPFFTADSPLIFTPTFQTWLLDPKDKNTFNGWKNLYSTGIDFRWLKPLIKDKLILDLGVTPLYSGTFHGKATKAMRYPAHIVGIWSFNPRLKIVFGVAYLDRDDDFNWIPMAGLIWTPHEDLNVELVMPRARISQRVRWFGNAAGDESSDWLYAGFEFGGGVWSREYSGTTVGLDYRDFRALLGIERRCASGITLAFETGYMFARKFEFNNFGKYEPEDTVFLRFRTSF
ncbi:hypothetical protein FACS1894214_1150 [Planctomycetales bacterium]|nr:hypothetical protein FACS1894214_1150 [Planctomycetales bacterium]